MVSSLLRSWHERVTARKQTYGKNKHTHPSLTVGECLFLLSSSLPTLFFPVFPLVSSRSADCRARGWERGEEEAAMGRGGEGEGSTGRREGRPRKVCSVADEAGGSEGARRRKAGGARGSGGACQRRRKQTTDPPRRAAPTGLAGGAGKGAGIAEGRAAGRCRRRGCARPRRL